MSLIIENKDQIFCRKHISVDRIPLSSLYGADILNQLAGSQVFLEQMLTSNEKLYYDLIKFKSQSKVIDDKKNKRLYDSVTKYFLRSKYRNTPFGLFSAVGLNDISLKDKEKNLKIRKEANISIDWFYNVINKYTNKRLTKYVFDNHIKKGEKIYFIKNAMNDNSGIYVDSNYLLQKIVTFCDITPKGYYEIINYIKKMYPNVSDDTIQHYTFDLININALKCELIPSLSDTDEDVLKKLIQYFNENENRDLSLKLHEVLLDIKNYNSTDIGKGIADFIKLKKDMNSIFKIDKDDLSVNSYYEEITNIYNSDLLVFSELIDKLTKLSIRNNQYTSYMDKFINKYGTNVEVPLEDMIDDNMGIGIPTKESSWPNNNHSKYLDQSAYYIKENCTIYNGVLNIVEEDLTSIYNIKISIFGKDDTIYPDSLDICFNCFNKKNENKYYITETLGSTEAFSMEGRFTLSNYLKEVNDRTIAFDNEDYSYCDINDSPSSLKNTNVSRSKHYCKSELTIGVGESLGKEQIKLKDISVGIDFEKQNFYFRNIENGKIIYFIDNNVLNPNLRNSIIEFLIESNNEGRSWWYNSPLNNYGDLFFSPRIVYKNVVLSYKKWKLKVNELNLNNSFEKKIRKIKKRFDNFWLSNKMPEYFYHVKADNKTIICKSDTKSMYSLYKEMISMKSYDFLFEELEDEVYDSILHGVNYDNFEIVLPMVSKNKIKCIKRKRLYDSNKIGPIIEKENHNWVYTTILFGSNEYRLKFLKSLNNEFIDNYGNDLQYFFINYMDEEKQSVRLRFNANDKGIAVQGDLKKYLLKKILNGKIVDFSFNNYIPEFYRYGEDHGLPYCESIFYYDSIFSLRVIEHSETVNDKILYLILDMIVTMSYFNMNIDSMENFIKKNINITKGVYTEENIWFRDNKDNIENLIYRGVLKENHNQISLDSLKLKEPFIKDLTICIDDINVIDDIIASLFHMSCNRILGIDRGLESKTMYLLYKTIMHLKYKKVEIDFNESH